MNPHLAPWNIAADDFPADGYASDRIESLPGYGDPVPPTPRRKPRELLIRHPAATHP